MTIENTVLLVDDDKDYLDTMELYLPDGCRAIRAVSIEEAKRAVTAGVPDCAVVDIRLNDDDGRNREGLELLPWLREHASNMPVIMISAYREFEYAAESLSQGAAFFLRKPIQPDEFRETVEKALGRD